MRRSRVLAVVLAVAAAVAVAGCGVEGPGAGTRQVSLRVTRDFGARTVTAVDPVEDATSQNDMELLQHNAKVTATADGRRVRSIAGHAEGSGTDWFLFIDGVQERTRPAAVDVHTGDHIWWDLHDAGQTDYVPAVVGSFPEPFSSGINGQRYPTTLECGSGSPALKSACTIVGDEMAHLKIPASPQVIGTGSGPDTLGMVVGDWHQVEGEVAAEYIKYGPGASGVYARFSDSGHAIELLDPAGRVVRTLTGSAGLIAATGDRSNVPTWLITGTDPAGVQAAARALTPSALAGHFALAVSGRQRIPVPIVSGS
jgi:hypothetical protein